MHMDKWNIYFSNGKTNLRENARWNVNKTIRGLVRKRIKHRKEGKTKKSQTHAGKISIGLQLGRASLETRNLSLGCLRFFRLALLPMLDPLYLY